MPGGRLDNLLQAQQTFSADRRKIQMSAMDKNKSRGGPDLRGGADGDACPRVVAADEINFVPTDHPSADLATHGFWRCS